MSNSQPDGFLALPAAGKGRPVLVLHPWWGLNDTIKAFCNKLADAGFTAFGADLYHGKVVDTIPDAEAAASAIFGQLDQARAEVAAAAHYLYEYAGEPASGLCVVGFSLGAFFALDLSIAAPELARSVVVFYGTYPDDFTNSEAAYLCHFAENDAYEPASEVENLKQALRQTDRPAIFYEYPGTGHWFFEPDRTDAYDATAANLAWERTLAFLKASQDG